MLNTIQQRSTLKPTLATSFKSFSSPDVKQIECRYLVTDKPGGTGIKNLMELPKGKYQLNATNPNDKSPVAFTVDVDQSGYKKDVTILNDKKVPVLFVNNDRSINPDIKVRFTYGKDGIVGKVSGDDFNTFMTIEDAEVKGKGFHFEMPYEGMPKTSMSFKGNSNRLGFGQVGLSIVLAKNPEASIKATNDSLEQIDTTLPRRTINTKFSKEIHSIFNVGGFGERLLEAFPGLANKPAMVTPAGTPLLAESIIPVAKSGFDLPKQIDEQNCVHIEPDIQVGTAGGDTEAIRAGKIPNDKVLAIFPGDGSHDLDLEPVFERFLNNKEAGSMIVSAIVPEDEIHSLGILGTNKDGLVTSFIEKPQNPILAKEGVYRNKNGIPVRDNNDRLQYQANIAIYSFKPKLTQALMDLEPLVRAGNISSDPKIRDNYEKGSKGKEYDYGKHALPALQVLCNGDILDDTGEKISEEKFAKEMNLLKEKYAQSKEPHPLTALTDRFGVKETVKMLQPIIDDIKDESIEDKVITGANGEQIIIKDKRLKMVSYAVQGSWIDKGNYKDNFKGCRRIAKSNDFVNFPPVMKKAYQENVDLTTGVVYNGNSRESFDKRFKAKGNVMVLAEK